MSWHSLSTEEVVKALGTSTQGLSEEESRLRLAHFGYNEIKEAKKISPFEIFLRQFRNVLVLLLLAAVAVSAFVGEVADAIVILIIVFFIAVLGFVQEYRAERAMAALKRLAAPRARVLRGGEVKEIPARGLVPGDVILLGVGDRVPADARVLEAVNLSIDESPLTGESAPVEKLDKALEKEAVLAEQRNMVFASTSVTHGRGKGVVIATGMKTEFGKIAAMLQEEEKPPTPLEQRLDYVGKRLGMAAIIIVIMVIVTEIFIRGKPALEIMLWGIALAVAAVPEALPAVVTGALAIGMQRMARRNAVVRKLPAVETLGSVTVICSDKTGTLTRGEMVVREIFAGGKTINVTGEGFDAKGEFYLEGEKIELDETSKLLLKIGALCNDASLNRAAASGDPTEIALLAAAAKAGLQKHEMEKEHPRVGEIGFSSERKLMTTLHRAKHETLAYAKGAPEVLLELCSRIYAGSEVVPITPEDKLNILEITREMGSRGLRVLGFAFKTLGEKGHAEEVERELVFAGLQGMIDAPREEAKQAAKLCEAAGIKTVMITGDNRETAIAVARELGMLNGRVLTGAELDGIGDGELERIVEDIAVYARVSPAHKLRIVKALKGKGHVVAMTGDGVNDAPALRSADIGVAMGITGTDVTKEASDMVLADDNFATIVAAIEEGRRIYDNIKKYLLFLLSCNAGEVLFLFLAALLDLPLVLLAIHILYINLATDGLPALALGVDPAEQDVMRRKPRNPRESIFNGIKLYTAALSVYLTILVLAVFYWALGSLGLEKARSMVFAFVIIFELFNAFNCRSLTHSIFNAGAFQNRWLVYAVLWEFALLNAVLYTPFLNEALRVLPLSAGEYGLAFLLGASAVALMEILKALMRR